MSRILRNLNHIVDCLTVARAKSKLRIAFYSTERSFFCPDEEVRIEEPGFLIEFKESLEELLSTQGAYDVLMLACHNAWEDRIIWEARRRGVADLYVAWLWDNHHHPANNMRMAAAADLVLVSHWFDRGVVISQASVIGPHVPPPSRQWSPAAITRHYPSGLPLDRNDGLFGGFGLYSFTPRTRFLQACQAALPGHRISLIRDLRSYFARPYSDRLAEWMGHKVQLLAPVNRDVSTRLFESLITGQIPLIPEDCPDLDLVVPPTVRDELPIIRYVPGSVDSVVEAHRAAIRSFDEEGQAGIERRSAYVMNNHSVGHRLRRIARLIKGFQRVTLGDDAGAFGAFAKLD